MERSICHRDQSHQWGVRLVACLALVVACVAVGWPGSEVAARIVGAIARGEVASGMARVSWGLLAGTLGYAGGIAVLATMLGLPAAWWIARSGWRVAPFAAVPLLMPMYLAYAGYGLLRAPRTWLGDWLARLAEHGFDGAPVLAGRVIAIVGLSLWAWPIAALVLAAGIRRLDPRVLALMRLDCPSAARRWWMLAGMLRAWLAGAASCVGLVMLGSAVPLHVSQAPTYSVRIWLEMTLAPGSVGPWISAWPLLAIAVGGTIWLRRGLRLLGASVGGWVGAGRPSPMAWLVMALSVCVPLALLASSTGGWNRMTEFWVLSGGALAQSATWAAVVGVLCATVCAGVWVAFASPDRPARCAGEATLAMLLVAALVPGVLVGQATALAWNRLGLDTSAPLVFAHVARFAGVAAVLGWLVAHSEFQEERMLRRIDGQEGLAGLVRVAAPGRWPVVPGAGLAGASLSLHEIESSVFLQLPGLQSLPQTLLGYLHYSRQEELSAACVWLIGLGVLGALGAAWAIGSASTSAGATAARRL
jgi:ABC-type spermidine/putrescine transport system permease subunit II